MVFVSQIVPYVSLQARQQNSKRPRASQLALVYFQLMIADTSVSVQTIVLH